MAATLTASPIRISPDLSVLRAKLPYVDYEASPLRPDNHAHPHASPSQHQQTPTREAAVSSRWKSVLPTYGSRHIHDVADFTLWCEETADFKHPTREQQHWILRYYHAKEVRFEYPLIIVITDTPPKPLTLTIAGVAALFVPDAPLCTGFRVNTAYASPRVPDPSPITLKRWLAPTKAETDLILACLAPLCNVKAINWFGVYCYVELHTNDGRSYDRHSLPGRVAGKTTTYHHSNDNFWDDMKSLALIRRIDPQDSALTPPLQDRTNYLSEGSGVLQPGVRIANSLDIDNTFTDLELATSCGVRLRHSTGQVVVTVANHGVRHCQDVYHPSTTNGSKIGRIIERWEAQDVAMVDLIPAVRFSNNQYFQATTPKRLVRSDNVPSGTWCSCDGMSTGVVFLHCQGARVSDIHMEVTNGINIEKVFYLTEKLYSTFGPMVGQLSDGICGAPIVEEGSDTDGSGGGVCSMFRFGNESIAVAPVLDDILDAGWELY